MTVKENAFGEDKVLEFCGGTYSEVCQGNLRVAVASEKNSLYVVPKLGS